MSKEKDIQEIERILSSLDYHLQKYKDYKYDSNKASRQKDRSRAFDDMVTHAQYIENLLLNPLILSIISTGNPFQFEEFQKYVDSDMPEYLGKIESFLEKLRSENEEK